ncbi:F0F1 ATP synthase subunit B [Halioxenophilus aromaticivorans]|uniref:ATP synthase subunit b n=1 Tax=Halioxenophilus aromaticivorans TaxID=1306992 RepID=A0AAV3U8S4_9ALTE
MNINLTLIGQSITFFIFILFCWKYVWPALIGVMAEREAKIAAGLEAAERADKDLELAKKKATEQMKEAKQEAASIVDAANKRANQIVEEAKQQAVVEADRVKAAADAEVQQMVNRAKEDLRSKVASLALAGASQVLQKNIDPAANTAMVEKLANEL